MSERGQADHYVIRISGHLGQRWSSRLAGMAIRHDADGTSALSGRLADQAALHGVLAGLRDLGIPIVSVQRVEAGDASSEEQAR